MTAVSCEHHVVTKFLMHSTLMKLLVTVKHLSDTNVESMYFKKSYKGIDIENSENWNMINACN